MPMPPVRYLMRSESKVSGFAFFRSAICPAMTDRAMSSRLSRLHSFAFMGGKHSRKKSLRQVPIVIIFGCATLPTMTPKQALKTAVKQAGGPANLARALHKDTKRRISRQAVDQWAKVPPLWALAVERITGVPRYTLRPDIYGPAP